MTDVDDRPANLTLHPFNDEWLWDDTGREPMRFASVAEAAAEAMSYRAETIKNNPGEAGRSCRELAAETWYSVVRPGRGLDGLIALVGPDDTVYEGDEAHGIYARVGRDGNWPGSPSFRERN